LDKNQIIEVTFLDEKPLAKDELNLHNKIAKLIKDTIFLIKDNKNKVIGLFGSWGSGKSTIVEILKDNEKGFFKEDNIFIFDSWSHKGDFLKRAFLLELAKKLKVENENYEKNSNETKENSYKTKKSLTIKDVLSKKVVSRIIDSEPSVDLNNSIKFIFYILLFSLIIVALSKIVDYLVLPLILKFFSLEADSKLFIKGILILFLFFIGIFSIEKLDDFIKFYFFKKIDVTESHTTKEDLEFTTYDYANYFKYIFTKKHEKNNKENNGNNEEPFIIIFDNLDRVDDGTVLDTLSLIQLNNEVIKKENLNNIYFLIPIDKERLEKTIKSIINEDEENPKKFVKDFLEKVFPYKIEIPNITHCDWRKFFNDNLNKAFNNSLKEQDILFIRRFFEEIIKKTDNNLTPREIKNFINNLVQNYLFWKNKIDIKVQAVYIILKNFLEKKKFDKIIKEIENGKRLSESLKEDLKFQKLLELINDIENDPIGIESNILKQFYKVVEIYSIYIEKFNRLVKEKDIKEINKIIKIINEESKIDNLLKESITRLEDECKQDINLLLNLFFVLEKSDIKKYSIIYKDYIRKLVNLLKEDINNSEVLSKLNDSNLEILSSILKQNEEIKKLFINKSIEISTTITEEKENEA